MRGPSWVVVAVVALILVAGAAFAGSSLFGPDDTTSAGGFSAGGLDPVADKPRAEGQVTADAFTRFDGSSGSFDDYRGKPLVVNFFASTCVPCVTEMPEFEEVFQQMRGDVAFLGMNVAERLADGERIAQATGVTYDLAHDPQGAFLAEFGGTLMPTTALIRADGTVAEIHIGELRGSDLEALIDQELL